jgi:release factor glutamine methyltransferase
VSPAPTPELWTIQRVLTWTQGHFKEKGIDSPRLEAELLLAHVLGRDRVYLYTHFEQPLSESEREAYRGLIKRRAGHEPLAYIVGSREFFSRSFKVSPAVLIPRPETEHVVEAVLAWVGERQLEAPTILDIGTGSGIIAVTLACELRTARVTATDISTAALAVARENAEAHQVGDRVRFVAGNLFEALKGEAPRRFHVVASNPPYVDPVTRDTLQPEVRDFEPISAIFAEAAGLDVIRRLCADVAQHLESPGLFACELGHGQQDAVRDAAAATGAFTAIDFKLDLQEIPRVLVAETP